MTRLDEAIQQLTEHQDAITTIQATQDSHSAMLETLTADNIDIKTSINHIIGSLSSLATKLNIQITLPQPLRLSPAPPTLLSTAAASSRTLAPLSPMVRGPPPKPVAVATFDQPLSNPNAAAGTPTPLTTAATKSTAPAPPLPQTPGPAAPFLHLLSRPIMAPSSPVKPYNSTHQILKSFSDSHIEFLFGIPDTIHIMYRKQQLKIALNSFDKSMLVRAQIAIGCGAVFEQKYRKDDTSPYIKMLSESKVFVFDPGGTLRVARVFDLEDKVDLEGVGIDTYINQPTPEGIARPRRTIHLPRRFLD